MPFLTLWGIGLATGSVHPLGVLAAAAGLIIYARYAAALGMLFSMVSSCWDRAIAAAVLALLTSNAIALLFIPLDLIGPLGGSWQTVWLAGVTPLVEWVSLASPVEIRWWLEGRAWGGADRTAVGPLGHAGTVWILVSSDLLASLILHAIGTVAVMRVAAWLFDSQRDGFRRPEMPLGRSGHVDRPEHGIERIEPPLVVERGCWSGATARRSEGASADPGLFFDLRRTARVTCSAARRRFRYGNLGDRFRSGPSDTRDDAWDRIRTRRTFMKDCSTSAAALVVLTGARAGRRRGRGRRPGRARPISASPAGRSSPSRRSHRALPDLRGRAAVRPSRRPAVDDAANSSDRRTRTSIKPEEPGLYSINTKPKFGIGQRAFLIQTTKGNILWDCVALVDDATIARVKELGGIAEIAVSHPHYYTAMVEWSRAFDGAQIHLHEAKRQWVMRPDPCIRFWKGRTLGAARGPGAGQHRRPLRRLPGPALAGRRRRPGSADGRRSAADLHGPQAGHLHVQLPQLHPAERPIDPPRHGMPRPARI